MSSHFKDEVQLPPIKLPVGVALAGSVDTKPAAANTMDIAKAARAYKFEQFVEGIQSSHPQSLAKQAADEVNYSAQPSTQVGQRHEAVIAMNSKKEQTKLGRRNAVSLANQFRNELYMTETGYLSNMGKSSTGTKRQSPTSRAMTNRSLGGHRSLPASPSLQRNPYTSHLWVRPASSNSTSSGSLSTRKTTK